MSGSAAATAFAPYRCLAAGATIALIAPAGPATEEAASQVPDLIRSLGWQPRLYPSCAARGGYLAGPDAQRLDDLHAAFADDDCAAVWCLRGGYGSARLLPSIDTALLRAHPKPLIGYSDITALHALLLAQRLLGIHAPMPASDLVKPGRDEDTQAIAAWLRHGLRAGTVLAPRRAAGPLHIGGTAAGRLIGGNLALLASLAGTPWAPDYRGAVLFIEEIGEEPYRFDRLLLQLKLSGALGAVAGFVLGSFTEAEDPAPLLRDYLQALGKPVLSGWPSGHGTPNRPLPMGAQVMLDADAGTLTIEQDVILPAARHT